MKSVGTLVQTGVVNGDLNLHPGAGHQAAEYRAPRQLPATSRHFVGRAEELGRLTALAEAPSGRGNRVCVVEGAPGVGKTSLVTRWAHDVADRLFPDGQIYLNLHGFTPGRPAVDHERATLALLAALRVPPERVLPDADLRMALFRDLVHDRSLLLVLDNALDSGQVEPLLPGDGSCFVVVTTRRNATGLRALYGAESVRLELLARDESLELFGRYLGAERAGSPAVHELARKCADLPLAISIAAAAAGQHPGMDLDRFAGEPLDESLRLDLPAADVWAVVASSCRLLSAGAARVLRLTALWPGDAFGAEATAAVCGLGVREAERLLRELVSHNLLLTDGRRYRCHDLLRTFAQERCAATDPAADRDKAITALLDYALHAAFRADRYLNAHRRPIAVPEPPAGMALPAVTDYAGAVAWFGSEITALLGAARLAFDRGSFGHAWMIPWTLVNFLSLHGRWQDWIDSHTTALDAARLLHDVTAESRVLQSLARAHTEAGQPDRAVAHYSAALANYRRAGDTNGEANCLNGRAGSHLRAGRPEDALPDATAALAIYTARDDTIGRASTINLIGRVQTALGARERAVVVHGEALRLFRRAGDRYGQAQALGAMGLALSASGRHRFAVVCHQRAVALHEELGSTVQLALARDWAAQALAAEREVAR
ncbi:tetratricopeptide repeat protein [Nocardia sp. NRRL S-836]|uniref:tetratricopeptide repeat protein n=1 Tax=Nocardia sp. NRRL S-836 TaxID=1519492 RepID=UPI0006AE6DA4|nr:tetratricopeptide repeat protein [Nocardia sp. NRRL S-836]KOV90090.1 hypothetical protein ADL03_01750 [Nocardia sp. NRRL S-836]